MVLHTCRLSFKADEYIFPFVAANVCLDGKNFYLIDYGFVTSPKKGVARAGSLIFMAPEVLLNNGRSFANFLTFLPCYICSS